MEKKTKKSIFKIIVYLLNFIVIAIMLVNIFNAFVIKECDDGRWYDKNGNLCRYDNEGNIWRYDAASNLWENLEPFNSKFTVYEGKSITGSQIRQLVKVVNANNLQNLGTDFIVEITGTEISGNIDKGYQFNGRNSQKYIVEIEKQDGVVSNINIYNTNDNQNNVITNNINEKNIDNITKNKVSYKIDSKSGIASLISYLPIIILYIIVIAYRKINKKRISKKYIGQENQYRLDKTNKISLVAFFIIDICLIIYIIYNYIIALVNVSTISVAKPIIYIYPEEVTEVTVQLGKSENLTCTYPIYKEKWEVTAEPNGTLKDNETGKTYYALYWEGKNIKKYTDKLKDGFIVKGEDTVKFLEEKLAILGLNEKESEEFIIYWLPKMQNNKYNYIRFQTQEEINENMPLEITPKPETIIRVMMEWKGLNEYEDIEEQKLEKVERKGYTVVEWGGTEIK